MGWMQFMPSTWKTYGVDANGDGVANPEDPVDAIFAAARYLHASGSVDDLGSAVFSYNHAGWYVARVLQRAVEIGSIPEDLLTSLTEAGRRDAGALRRATGATGYLDDRAEPDTIGRVMLLSDDEARRRDARRRPRADLLVRSRRHPRRRRRSPRPADHRVPRVPRPRAVGHLAALRPRPAHGVGEHLRALLRRRGRHRAHQRHPDPRPPGRRLDRRQRRSRSC